MRQALEDVTVTDPENPDAEVLIHGGKRFHDEDPLVRAYPDLFVDADRPKKKPAKKSSRRADAGT